MKKLVAVTAPVGSRSGYGAHSRDLVWSFIQHDKYDIKIMDVRWGDCPHNALDENDPKDKEVLKRIINIPVTDRQPDIYIDIRIPNEFESFGKFNIGITAGIETNVVSQKWVEACNKMDLVIVPSEHSKGGFINSIWDKVETMPDGSNRMVGQIKMQKPVEVLFEGADEDIYKPLTKDEIDSDFFDMLNEKVPEKFAFLFVGQWTKGGYGEDRKDIGTMIKTFYESFANKKKQPALIVKTSGATHSVIDHVECLKKMNYIKGMFPPDWKLPNVYLLHGDLSNVEMNYLYNHPKVKCMVSFTHGEGFGRPLLEATMTGLPIIASGWSGQIDFLNRNKSLLLPGKVQKIPESAVWEDILIPESQWFEVDTTIAYKAMNDMFSNYEIHKRKAKSLQEYNKNHFTLKEMVKKLSYIMDMYITTETPLTLPKLMKKSESTEKISLPKLNKLTADSIQ